MAAIEDIPPELYALAEVGEQMESFLKSEAYKTGLTLARARIFDGWTTAVSPREREELHAEQRALERLIEAFRTIDEEGYVARDAIRRARESDTDL